MLFEIVYQLHICVIAGSRNGKYREKSSMMPVQFSGFVSKKISTVACVFTGTLYMYSSRKENTPNI